MTASHTGSVDVALVRERNLGGRRASKRVAVIWIDWYAYHVARFRALADHPFLEGRVAGIELVGGAGVHDNLVFRAAGREGLPITTLIPDRGWSEAGQFRLARKLWVKLNEFNPDVLLIPGYYTVPAIAATLWARYHNKRTILMSESTLQDHRRNRWKEAMKGAVLKRLFHASIAGGVRQAAYLKTLGFREDQIARRYDVVDNDYFERQADYWRRHSTPRSLGLPEDYFLYVGRMAPEKNVAGLIGAFKKYRQWGGTWSLVLAGDGPDAHALKEMVIIEGLSDYAIFTGLKSIREIVPYYAFANCFVLPSLREPWGLVVNEAMAAGLPLIVSDRCGCSDDLLDHDRNGYGFDPAQPQHLPLLMKKFTDLSEAQRQLMGRSSREIISQYSPQLWAKELIRIAGINTKDSPSIA